MRRPSHTLPGPIPGSVNPDLLLHISPFRPVAPSTWFAPSTFRQAQGAASSGTAGSPTEIEAPQTQRQGSPTELGRPEIRRPPAEEIRGIDWELYTRRPRRRFSSSDPFVPPPSFGPLRHSGPPRHSGESRNPEDTFPLGPGFRRGDEGAQGRRVGAPRQKRVAIPWIPAFMGMTTGRDLRVCNSPSIRCVCPLTHSRPRAADRGRRGEEPFAPPTARFPGTGRPL